MIYGNDVSGYQSSNPTFVKNAAFCFVKVTEGTSYTNPNWVKQRKAVKAKGLVFGAYHFAHPKNGWKAEADKFLKTLKVAPGDLVALDWEPYNQGVSASLARSYKDAWLRYVKSKLPHNRVGLYCDTNYWKTVDKNGFCGDFLWIADYGTSAGRPRISDTWTIHQYTDKPIDTNLARFADKAALSAWAHGLDPKPPVVKPTAHKNKNGRVLGSTFTATSKTVKSTVTKTYYVVKSGDTQSAIAVKFKVSLNRLKALNSFKNTRLSVGQEVIVYRLETAVKKPAKVITVVLKKSKPATPAKPKVVEQMPKILASMKGQVGYREGKSNLTKYAADLIKAKIAAKWWQNAPWCATFDVWNFWRTGMAHLVPATPGCATAVAWWKSKKRFSTYPAVGALVYYGPGGGSHTGIVYAYDSTYIYTVEGNTNNNGSAEGNGVYYKKRLRKSSHVYGYGYPAYAEGIKSADSKWAGNYKGSVK